MSNSFLRGTDKPTKREKYIILGENNQSNDDRSHNNVLISYADGGARWCDAERQTCDQKVAGSTHGRFTITQLLSPSSKVWYRPNGDDAL